MSTNSDITASRDFVPVSQALTGAGTAGDPFRIATVVDAGTFATVNNGGPGLTILKTNNVFGTLACTANNPAPTNAGQANTAGSKTGQCTGLYSDASL